MPSNSFAIITGVFFCFVAVVVVVVVVVDEKLQQARFNLVWGEAFSSQF